MADFENLGFEARTVEAAGHADHWARSSQATAETPASYVTVGGNMFLYSEELDNAAWTKLSCTITANSVANPPGLERSSGANAVDTLVDTVDGGPTEHRVRQNFSPTPSVCLSAYLKKAGSLDFAYFTVSPTGYVWFDLTNGEVGTIDNGAGPEITATIEDIGSGWYLCTASVKQKPAGLIRFEIGSASTDGSRTYVGTGADVLYIYGAQLNQGFERTLYVKTEATALPAEKSVEDFETLWAANETAEDSLEDTGATAIVLATYPTTTPPTTKGHDDFEELWSSNETFSFELGAVTAAAYGGDAFEDLEEDWSNSPFYFTLPAVTAADYQYADTMFDPYEDFELSMWVSPYHTSLPASTAASYDVGSPENVEDFEEEWTDVQMSTI